MGPKSDINWDFGDMVGDNRKKIKCKLCQVVTIGGITRLKQHIAHTSGEVEACKKASKEISVILRKHFQENKTAIEIMKKRKKTAIMSIREESRHIHDVDIESSRHAGGTFRGQTSDTNRGIFRSSSVREGPKKSSIVTDSEASNKAAGKWLMLERPHIFWSPCTAHCTDLILEDIGSKTGGSSKKATLAIVYVAMNRTKLAIKEAVKNWQTYRAVIDERWHKMLH
ncbi:hypothetical protein MIMGU_mgv11b023448mg [Erythranthe guttata]|uniref:BED-type domain-containing protein n=1 Tax=Erythranthe guttata TaxID=4155 RepID=A0A022QKT7_ERYGU|nr:hypothetical protein MIMGU_mgv11b023448mg [Erythranthe guttata]